MQRERNYWVWVTGPDYYLDEDGDDRRSLEPEPGYAPGAWWTCHKNTEDGDLVLLYRSKERRDLAYLIEARSDAYSLLDNPEAAEEGWDYGCDFEVIEKFTNPLTLSEMKDDPALANWGALRASFQQRVYAIPPDTWNHLLDRLAVDRQRTERKTHAADQRYALERDIENRLAADLSVFGPHGLTIVLRTRQHVCLLGGRADLVGFEPKMNRYVVIELKRSLVGRDAVAQLLSYMASIAREFPDHGEPLGVLAGDRLDNEAAGIIEDHERLRFIPLAELESR